MPTTAGTGSEVACGSILTVDDGRKLGVHSWHRMPRAALPDPGLTLGLPHALTAATGLDAIKHRMKTFRAPAVKSPADGIALDGLARGWAHIERATRDGQDREARWNMMSASMQGAMAFQKGLGGVHSLSHCLTEGGFERVIDGALADHCHKTGPRVATREDYRELLRQSLVRGGTAPRGSRPSGHPGRQRGAAWAARAVGAARAPK